jgi:ABC-2 type transport system permease protein
VNRPAARRGWWIVQLRGELEKLFARKRTYIGFGAFVAMEILILAILTLPRARQAFGELMANNGLRFEDG